MYRILTFDGGGIRGLVALTLLQRLQEAAPDFIGKTDLLAGTSTGGIIALGLAAGKSVEELTHLYLDNGKAIFDESWLRDIVDLGKIAGAEYDSANLEKILRNKFGELRLDQLAKRVLIPSFELDNGSPDPNQHTWKPVFFH